MLIKYKQFLLINQQTIRSNGIYIICKTMEIAKFLNKNVSPFSHSYYPQLLAPSQSSSKKQRMINTIYSRSLQKQYGNVQRNFQISSEKPSYIARGTVHKQRQLQHCCTHHSTPQKHFKQFLRKGTSSIYENMKKDKALMKRSQLKFERATVGAKLMTEGPSFKSIKSSHKSHHPICALFRIKCDRIKCKLDCFNRQFEEFLKNADLQLLKGLQKIVGRSFGISNNFKIDIFDFLQKFSSDPLQMDNRICKIIHQTIPKHLQKKYFVWVESLKKIHSQLKNKHKLNKKQKLTKQIEGKMRKILSKQKKNKLEEAQINIQRKNVKRMSKNINGCRSNSSIRSSRRSSIRSSISNVDENKWRKNKTPPVKKNSRVIKQKDKNRKQIISHFFAPQQSESDGISNKIYSSQASKEDNSMSAQIEDDNKQLNKKSQEQCQLNSSKKLLSRVSSVASFCSKNQNGSMIIDPHGGTIDEQNLEKYLENTFNARKQGDFKDRKKNKRNVRSSSRFNLKNNSSLRSSISAQLNKKNNKNSMDKTKETSLGQFRCRGGKEAEIKKKTLFYAARKKYGPLLRKTKISNLFRNHNKFNDEEYEDMINQLQKNYKVIQDAQQLLCKYNKRQSILLQTDSKLTLKRKVRKISNMVQSGFFKKDSQQIEKYISLFSHSKQINERHKKDEDNGQQDIQEISLIALKMIMKKDQDLKFYDLTQNRIPSEENQKDFEKVQKFVKKQKIQSQKKIQNSITNWHMINKFENFVTDKSKTSFDFIHYSQMVESIIRNKKLKQGGNNNYDRVLTQTGVRSNIAFHQFFPNKI